MASDRRVRSCSVRADRAVGPCNLCSTGIGRAHCGSSSPMFKVLVFVLIVMCAAHTNPKAQTLTATLTTSESFSEPHSATPQLTASVVLTGSMAPTNSGTLPPTRTPTDTNTLEATSTVTAPRTPTVAATRTATKSRTITPPPTPTHPGTLTRRYTRSASFTHQLTTSVVPPTNTGFASRTLTFLSSCPDDCGHGSCNNRYPFRCMCHSDEVRGYWGGAEYGGPCSQCARGYFGLLCISPCPGKTCGSVCTGHGTCNDGLVGTGLCTCVQSNEEGYWAAPSCNDCSPMHYGPDCKQQCQCLDRPNMKCSDGLEGTGTCICGPGWYGPQCEFCESGLWGSSCAGECPGGKAGPCTGHGTCFDGIAGNGTCVCLPTWGGANCSSQCGGTNSNCSGHGQCLDGADRNGTCACTAGYVGSACARCRHGYWGDSCDQVCPGGTEAPCSNAGECQHNGTCMCNLGFAGSICSAVCPRDASGRVCSGRGDCSMTERCACWWNSTNGHWAGDLCDSCDPLYSGPNCTLPCPNTDGVPCSGHGSCTNGRCVCSSDEFCGTACERTLAECGFCPTAQLYGPDCDQQCQCSDNGLCNHGRTGDGSCTCARGWSGQHCELECPGGAATPCSQRGVCEIDATCTCAAGTAGPSCAVTCDACVHGVCRDGRTGNGTCECSSGYTGKLCDTFCVCAAHGTCNIDGACTCDPRWTGDFCDSCVDGYSGAACDLRCDHGTTNGTACECDRLYNGPGCASQCGLVLGLLCNKHGVCHEVDSVPGGCTCEAGWSGPGCQCNPDKCAEKMVDPTCDIATGECICRPGRGGETCEECSDEFWGTKCNKPCLCNNHGTCDRLTGACTCYRSFQKGFWRGATCSLCAEGYLSGNCTVRSSSFQQVSSVKVQVTPPGIKPIPPLMATDPENKLLFTAGRILSAADIGGVATATVLDSVNTSDVIGCGEVQNIWVLDGKLVILKQSEGTCRLPPTIYTALTDHRFTSSAFVRAMSLGDVNEDLNVEASICYNPVPHRIECCVAVRPIGEPLTLRCYWVGTGLLLSYPLSDATSVVVGYYAATHRAVYFSIRTTAKNPCSLVRWDVDDRVATKVFVDHQNVAEALSEQCVSITAIGEEPTTSTVLLGVQERIGDVVLVELRRDTIGTRPEFNVALTTLPVDTTLPPRIATISNDVLAEIVLVTVCYKGSSCTVEKFRLQEQSQQGPRLALYGQQPTTSGEQIVSAVLSSESRIAYFMTQSLGSFLTVRRYLMWEVLAVSPTLADLRGGTTVTVSGKGFRQPFSGSVQCYIGRGAPQPGTFVNSETIHCRAPPSTDGCAESDVEISLYGVFRTTNRIKLRHSSPAALVQVAPRRVKSGEFHILDVTGIGFRDDGILRCRVGVPPKEHFTLDATFVTASLIRCSVTDEVRPLIHENALLDVTLDGSRYSDQPLNFDVLGPPGSTRVEPKKFTLRAAQNVSIPAVSLSVLDINGNDMMEVDTRERVMHIGLSKQSADKYTLFGVTRRPVTNGVAAVEGLEFHWPRAGLAVMTVTLGPWPASVEITILPGSLHRIILSVEPSYEIGPEGFMVQNPRLELRDVADNQLRDADVPVNTFVEAKVDEYIPRWVDLASLPEEAQNTTVVVDGNVTTLGDLAKGAAANTPTQATTAGPSTGNATTINNTEAGGYTAPLMTARQLIASSNFEYVLRSIQARNGFEYYLTFSIADRPEVLPLQVGPLKAICETSQYTVVGERGCRECISPIICNGSNVTLLRDDYWRPTPASMQILECPLKDVCIGNATLATCKPEYTGPRCSVCAPDHGASVGRTCLYCFSPITNYLVMFGMLILMCFGAGFIALLAVQSVAESNHFIIIAHILISHLQTFAQVTLLDVEFEPFLYFPFIFMETVADFRILDGSFADCIVRGAGFSFETKFAMYSAIPLLSLIIAVAIYRVVKFHPAIFMNTASKQYVETSNSQYAKMQRVVRKRLPIGKKGAEGDKKAPTVVKKRIGMSRDDELRLAREKEELDKDLALATSIRPYNPHKPLRILVNSLLVLISLSSPTIIFHSMSMLNCEDIQYEKEVRTFLINDYSVRCDTSTFSFLRDFALTSYIVYVLAFPAAFLAYHGFQRFCQNLMTLPLYQLNGSFLFTGLRDQSWYWHCLVLVRKALIVTVVVLAGVPADTYVVNWILILYLSFVAYMRPYNNIFANVLDALSTAANVLSVNLVMLLLPQLTDDDGTEGNRVMPVSARLVVSTAIVLVQVLTTTIIVVVMFKGSLGFLFGKIKTLFFGVEAAVENEEEPLVTATMVAEDEEESGWRRAEMRGVRRKYPGPGSPRAGSSPVFSPAATQDNSVLMAMDATRSSNSAAAPFVGQRQAAPLEEARKRYASVREQRSSRGTYSRLDWDEYIEDDADGEEWVDDSNMAGGGLVGVVADDSRLSGGGNNSRRGGRGRERAGKASVRFAPTL